MGLIRSGLIFMVAVLFLVVVLVGNMFFMFNLSLDYNNVNSELKEIIKGVDLNGQTLSNHIDENLYIMQEYCSPNLCNDANGTLIENCTLNEYFEVTYLDYSLNISCESILNGSEAVVNEGINEISYKIYNDQYNCVSLIKCFKESNGMPFFILSQETKDYFENKFYLCLLGVLILFVLLIVLFDTKTNALIASGGILIFSALPFIKIYDIVAWVTKWEFLEFLRIFFSKSMSAFGLSFTCGLVLVLLGFSIKIFNLGFKLEGLVEKIFRRG